MKINKTTLSLLLVSTALYGTEQAITFASIDESVIHNYVQKITSEFKTNNVQKKVIYGAALLGLGYVTYQCFYGGQTPTPIPVKTDVPVPLIASEEIAQPRKLELSPAAIAQLNKEALDRAVKDNLSFIPAMYHWTKENFSILAQQTLVLAIFTGLNNSLGPIAKYISVLDGALDKVLTRVFHEWDISWFLKQHTQLPILFSTLEYHAKELAQDATQEFHLLQLQRTWNIMIHQFEYAFAFMHYSTISKPWYSLAILQVQALQDTMKTELHKVAHNLEVQLDELVNQKNNTNAESIVNTIQELRKILFQDFDAFKDLEKLKPY